MLKWFAGKNVTVSAIDDMYRKLIDENQVEVTLEKISDPDGALDENVDIHLIRKF